MAVAHSSASESHTGTTGSISQTSFSWTHTQTGTPQGVLVFVTETGGTWTSGLVFVTSVTYGSVSLTRITAGTAFDNAGEWGQTTTWFAGSGLPSGNQTITVNRANNALTLYASAATVTAAADTAIPGSSIVLLQGDGTLAVQSVNDTSPGTDSLRYASAYSGLGAPPAAGTGSTLLNSIDFGNYTIALVRETTAGQGARNVGFNSTTTDDRAVVHLAIRELVPRTLTQTVSAFTLTGNNATLTKSAAPKVMDGGTGAFTLAGQPADTRHNVVIESGTGAFSLTGSPVTLTETTPKAITADTGAFTLTGNPAIVRRGYALGAETGVFTAAGQLATLRQNPRIEANTGSFALSGGAPAMLRGWYLSGGAGTFIETGQPATFRRTWAVQAATGAFAFTGNPASLTELGAYEIDPIAGSFTLAGQPANLAQSQTMPITVGTFTFTGQPATLRQSQALAAETGSFNAAGQPAALTQGYRLQGGTGAFSFTGQPATLIKQSAKQLTADRGLFTLTGQPATLRQNPALTAQVGTFTLVGQSASLAVARLLPVQPGAFDLTGNNVALTEAGNFELIADTGVFAFTGQSATLLKASAARRRNVLIF